MVLRWILAGGHLLALGIGLGAIWARARGLRAVARDNDLRTLDRVFLADNWWGIAAGLWLVTGLWRLFAGIEKAPSYYYANHLFWTKMVVFGAVFLLELAPMISLIQWRLALRRGVQPDLSRASRWASISFVQVVLVILLVFAATGMARGVGS